MNQPNQIQIKASDEVLKGAYSNMAQIQHTKEEFVLDFLNVFPPSGMLTARVIVSPGHMKRMVEAMKDNLSKYETQFGSVAPSEAPNSSIGFSAS